MERETVQLYSVHKGYTDDRPKVYEATFTKSAKQYRLIATYGDADQAFGYCRVFNSEQVPGRTSYSGYIGRTREEALRLWSDALNAELAKLLARKAEIESWFALPIEDAPRDPK
jgi:hypothetical protein